jgi:hypothetical protein
MSIALPSLVSLVFVGIGGILLGLAIRMAGKARQSLSWPSTEGEIAHSAVLLQRDSSASETTVVNYRADIVYRYKVNGRSYSSSKIALVDLASSSGRAQALVERYPDQSTTEVYYNPADPAESVLEPGSSSGLTVLQVIGAISTLFGLVFLVMSLTGHVHPT